MPEPTPVLTATRAPQVTSVAFTSDAGEGETYRPDDAIEVTVQFDEPVYVEGLVQIELDFDGVTKLTRYMSPRIPQVNFEPVETLVLTYIVGVGNADADGIALKRSRTHIAGTTQFTFDGKWIRDRAGNASGTNYLAIDADAAHKVDGGAPPPETLPGDDVSEVTPPVDDTAPVVSEVSLITIAWDGDAQKVGDGTYVSGDYIHAAVTFSEEVSVTDAPQLTLDIGGVTRQADFRRDVIIESAKDGVHYTSSENGYASTALFTYLVEQGDADADGVAIGADALSLNNGTIQDAAGNDAVLTHSAVPTATPTPTSEPVAIPDSNLRREIERSLGKSPGTPIFRNEMETLRSFEVRYEQIGDLEGIQFATNLRRLELVEIRSSLVQGAQDQSPLDLSPIAALTNLTRLDLSQNKISDLLPLAGLTNLEYLSLEAVYIRWDESDTSTLDLSPLTGLTELTDLALNYNNILDISPLAGLTALERLNISKNHISDVSPLVGLTKLVHLNGQENEIVDVSPLSGLTALQEVVLSVNDISDISPLVANGGLGRGDVVDVRTNPLNAESIGTHIPALQARGVSVSFDEVIVFTDPQIYNGNVFVLPVSENLAAGDLPLRDYAERFYDHFNDEFDFLMFVPNLQPGQHEPGVNIVASYAGVKNDVKGIGESTFTNSDSFGSAGKLQGVINFGSYAIYSGRRSILFEGPTLHELMHRWANFIVPTSYGGHWGFSSANGNIGGFDIANLVDHGGGRYTAGSFTIAGEVDNVRPYSPIELYLAGFIPPGEVPDLWVAEDGEWLRDEEGRITHADNGHPMFTANQVRTYTIEDIIAEHGPRVPDSSQAQRDFRAAVILLVDQNHPATREALETLSADVSWFSHPDEDESDRYNFYEATGGRGTITMDSLSEFLRDREYPSVSTETTDAFLVRINSPITVTATFSEPIFSFTIEDVSVVNGAASNFEGSDGDTVYNFDVTPNAIGPVTVDIAAGVAQDADSNDNTQAVQLSLGIPYDDDHDDMIARSEVIAAIIDYFNNIVSREQVIALIVLYFAS